MLEREAVECWKNNLEENIENFRTFENYRKQLLENNVDRDFEELEDDDLHWLEVIAYENNISISELAKKGDLHHSVLYRQIERNSSFNNSTISTLNSLAVALNMTIQEFIDKYFDRFFKEE